MVVSDAMSGTKRPLEAETGGPNNATTTATTTKQRAGSSLSAEAAAVASDVLAVASDLAASVPPPFVELPLHGEHKRAVSAVSFAPSHGQSPFGRAAVCASASADGTVKLWRLADDLLARGGADGGDALASFPAATGAAGDTNTNINAAAAATETAPPTS